MSVMPSIYHLDLIPATSSEDVLGIASVSGFYGPGTYAAWIVTVAASWLDLRRGKQTQNIHHIAHLLYTNWAAIDLLHQLSVINHIEPATGLPYDSVSNLASVAAAFTATYWGMLQAGVQYILCVFYFDMAFEHESRSILFLFGLIIPSLTGPAYLYSLRSYMAKMDLHPYESGSHLITTLYYDGIDQSQHKWHMFWASFLMAAACPLVCIAAAHTLWIRYSRKEWMIEGTSIYASLIMPMAIACTGVEALTYVFKAV
jgi:hypothetical protein